MEQSSKETLVKVINLLKAGDQKAAIPILTALLKEDPQLEQGWYLLGMALEAEPQKIRAFKQVLKLNPTHEKAKKQLEKLEQAASPPPPPQKPVEEAGPFTAAPPTFIEDDPPHADEPPPKDRTSETSQSMKVDFELPDWMQQDSFDATDQLPQIPEAYQGSESEADGAPREQDQDEEVDIPDWAQRSEPPQPGPVLSEMEDQPSWMTDDPPTDTPKGPFTEDEELYNGQAFTGYSLDEDGEYDEDAPTETHSLFDDDQEEDEEEIEEGEPEWLRTMVEEDEGSGKKKRKKKKRKKRPKVELSPKEKRRRRRRIFWFTLLFLCVGLGGAGYFFQEELEPVVSPYIETYWPPVLTQAAPVTDLLTEGAPITDLLTRASPTDPNYLTPSPTPFITPTLGPTWTPGTPQQATLTTRPTEQPNGTPTPSQTSLPIPEDTQNEIRTIQEQVVELRRLPGPNIVTDDIIPTLKLRLIMEDWMLADGVVEQLETDRIVYVALGLVNSNYDLVTEALNSRVDAIGGFYLPEENIVYVVGNGFYGIQKYVYAHEYGHAIQDASFDLTGLGVYPTCTKPAQTCSAIMSLVEGDASLAQNQWFETYPPELESQDILSFTPPTSYFQDVPAPEYFEQNTQFPYTYGLEFVTYLYESGGWNAVNRAYQFLPETTEQIIHPEKYAQRERPIYIDYPDLTAIVTDGWEIIQSDALGEWATYLLLAYNDYDSAQQPIAEAKVAAAGWGNDRVEVLYNAETDETLLTAFWTWDSQTDANEFYNSLNAYLASRYQDTRVSDPSGTCWFLNNQKSCIYRQDKQILWLQSENLDMLDAAKEKFTAFP